MTPLRALWFTSGMGVIGIVMAEDHGEIYYLIGIAQGMHEQIDVNNITALGAKLPQAAGETLFGIKKGKKK
jgi:hypothetical protein